MFEDKTKRPRYHQTAIAFVVNKSTGYTTSSTNDMSENGKWIKNVLAVRVHKWNFSSFHMVRTGLLGAQDFKVANQKVSKYLNKSRSIRLDLTGVQNMDLYFNIDTGICRNVPCLKQLTLNFSNCLRFSIWHSYERWINLPNLQQLTITINRSFDLSDQSLENLDLKLRYLRRIRKLKLAFKECDKVTDAGLAKLGQRIQYMSKLENLAIDFSGCFQLTEPCIITLISRILSKSHQLKQLSLGFHGCHKISDNVLVLLGTYLNQNQVSLESLALNFGGCHRLTDAGFELLGIELIKHLTQLKELYFDFSWCRELTDKSFQAMMSEMSPRIESWQNIVLKFPG